MNIKGLENYIEKKHLKYALAHLMVYIMDIKIN